MSFAPAPLGPDARRRLERGFWGLSAVFTVIGMMVPMAFAQADIINYLFNIVMYGIAFILEKLLDFFGGFILMLVDAIISVSQYNTFTTATPVEAGWPLVRDVVNMFFIVVLLVTAFSTIIQYKKFDYKKILPKLLLMAVLVNFSKTIIGVLIDFSQVVMLTFVNGYKAAAAGNFTQVLKLDKIMQWASSDSTSVAAANSSQLSLPATQQTNDPMLVKIVLAEMLGMFMLGTSLVTLLVMLIYLIGRIIGLWIALIMSPLAFFVGALPGEMTKGAGAVTGDFWPRLSAMLTGGPIMAFFLWLTLATVQTGGFGNFNASQARDAETQGVIQYFSNSIGNTQELATFMVGVVMLLMGLDAAVSISKQVHPVIGNAASRIRDRGMRYTRLASYGALTSTAGLAARQVRRGAQSAAVGVGRLTESQLDITGRLGRGIQAVGSRIPGVGTAISAQGAKLTARRGTERARYTKELEAATASLAIGDRIKQLQTAAKITANKDKQKAAVSMVAKLQSSGDGVKAVTKKYEDEAKSKGAEGADAKAYGEAMARKEIGTNLATLKKLAEETNDDKTKKEYKEILEKRPDLELDDEALDRLIGGIMDDPEGGLKKLGTPAWQSERVLRAFAQKSGMVAAIDPATGELDKEHDSVKKVLEGGGSRAELIKQYAKSLRDTAAANNISMDAVLNSDQGLGIMTNGGRDVQGRTVWHHTPQRVIDSITQASAAQEFEHGATSHYRDQNQIDASVEQIRALRRDPNAQPNDVGIRTAQYNAMFAGAKLEEVYRVDDAGRFGDAQDRVNFTQNIQQVLQQGATNVDVYNQVDLSALERNLKGQNQARAIFTRQADLGQLTQSLTDAQAQNNTTALRQISNAVGAIHAEGERVEQLIKHYNETHPDGPQVDVAAVVTAAQANNEAALRQATSVMGNMSMDEAIALMKKDQIDHNLTLETARTKLSKRGRRARALAAQPLPPQQPNPNPIPPQPPQGQNPNANPNPNPNPNP